MLALVKNRTGFQTVKRMGTYSACRFFAAKSDLGGKDVSKKAEAVVEEKKSETKKKGRRKKKSSQAKLPAEKEAVPEGVLQRFKELLSAYLEVGAGEGGEV